MTRADIEPFLGQYVDIIWDTHPEVLKAYPDHPKESGMSGILAVITDDNMAVLDYGYGIQIEDIKTISSQGPPA